ncbi:MAG: LptA/OstA family protein [Pseudohongiellaceae bacterium]
MQQQANRAILSALLLSAFFPIATRALESDRDQDVEYSSDRQTVRVEGNTRILTLTDNVYVRQGTIELSGTVASFVYNLDTEDLLRVTVTGSPASYLQQINEDGEMARGTSSTIHYHTGTEAIVELVGDVRFEQPGLVNHCARVEYHLESNDLEGEDCEGVLSRQQN